MHINKLEIFISVIFILIGIYLLIERYLIAPQITEEEWSGVSKMSVFLNSSQKLNDLEIKKGTTSFIFISHDNDCSPCIVEIQEFIDLIINRNNEQAIVLFVGNDINKTKRTIQLLDINTPLFFGEIDIYQKLIGNKKIYNQVIIFDKQGKFLKRKYLSKNQISSIKQKNDLLNQYWR